MIRKGNGVETPARLDAVGRAAREDRIDQAVVAGFVRTHEIVAIDITLDLFQRPDRCAPPSSNFALIDRISLAWIAMSDA